MDHRTTRALAAAALALAVGACSDLSTNPAAARVAGVDAPARTVSASGPTLIANTVKYRDTGGKPARGRSGAAALEAFALLGKDGHTDLEYRAVAADPWNWWVWGTMTRAQVKALDADSTVMFIYNENNLNTDFKQTRFSTLARGQYLQVQANITGIDPHRVDVVTATERIKLRPDLAVRLSVPAEVPATQWVPVTATVSELNGDVGARASCVLRVNDTVVDYAWGVWVDAGDAVSCAFAYPFSPGTHQVQVEVTDVSPGDWDNANNRSEVVQVQAVGGPTEFTFSAYASSYRYRDLYHSESRWHNPVTGIRGETLSESNGASTSEYAYMSGWIPRSVSGEMSLEVSQTTGGRVVHADAWTEPGTGCTSRWTASVSFFLCSYTYGGWAETWFSYYHMAGAVTYHSKYFYREWDEGTGEDLYYYSSNYSGSWEYGQLAGFGDDYAFHVRVASGDLVLTADTEFPLHHNASSWNDSYCYGYTDPWDGFTSESCTTYETSFEHRSGYDSSYW